LREAAADRVIDTVGTFAPNFRASVLGRMTLTPLDLERRFGLSGGDIFHGALSLDQLFSARPVLGNANYRMPLAGLYLCGSGAHPGCGVTGCRHNARAKSCATSDAVACGDKLLSEPSQIVGLRPSGPVWRVASIVLPGRLKIRDLPASGMRLAKQ
jgi:hypothetical protein